MPSPKDKPLDMFDDQICIKMEPELRHVLAHIYYAIECLAQNAPIGALDNLKSIEGLLMFEGDELDWERFYRKEYGKWLAKRKQKRKLQKNAKANAKAATAKRNVKKGKK